MIKYMTEYIGTELVYNTIYTMLFIYVYYYLILSISFFGMLKKDEKNPFIALIPFYNIYKFAEFTKISWLVFYIPFINIIYLFVLPYRIGKQYNINEYLRYIGVIIPFIILPWIAFSDKKNKYHRYRRNFLKTVDDVNDLETKLVDDKDVIIDDFIETKQKKIENIKRSTDFIEEIESNIINDDFVFDEVIEEDKDSVGKVDNDIMDIYEDDMIDLNDEGVINNDITSINSIDILEDDIKHDTIVEKQDIADIKEYEGFGPTDSAIAFGGKNKIENNTVAKVEDLKCKRCGSSLVGNNGYCPGCGIKL